MLNKMLNDEELLFLLDKGEKIKAIRLVMDETGRSLREAKDYVEALPSHKCNAPLCPEGGIGAISGTSRVQEGQIRILLEQGEKLKAIQLTVKQSGMSLYEAKEYVERLSYLEQPANQLRREDDALMHETLLRFQEPKNSGARSKKKAAVNKWAGRIALAVLIMVLASIVIPLLGMCVMKLLGVLRPLASDML